MKLANRHTGRLPALLLALAFALAACGDETASSNSAGSVDGLGTDSDLSCDELVAELGALLADVRACESPADCVEFGPAASCECAYDYAVNAERTGEAASLARSARSCGVTEQSLYGSCVVGADIPISLSCDHGICHSFAAGACDGY